MNKRKLAVLLAATTLTVMSFAACGGSASTDTSSSTDTAEAETATEETVEVEAEESATTAGEDDAADAGFEENPIFEDEEIDFLNVSAVYFQAVPMENESTSYSEADADIHIEADISALENDLGYGVGDWVPYLTVDYLIEDEGGNEVVSGTFMEMAASDGPHYGANIKLDPGTYNLTLTIHSPGENGYLIHSDSATGPGGSLAEHFKDGNFVYTYEGWDFPGLE